MMPSDRLVKRTLKLFRLNNPREHDEGFKMTKWQNHTYYCMWRPVTLKMMNINRKPINSHYFKTPLHDCYLFVSLYSNLGCSAGIWCSAELRSETISPHRARAQKQLRLKPAGINISIGQKGSPLGWRADDLFPMWVFPLQIPFAKSSSFVFDGVLCPSEPFIHCVAATAGMSDGLRDRKRNVPSPFLEEALRADRGWALEGEVHWVLRMDIRVHTGSVHSWNEKKLIRHPMLVLQFQ